VQPQRLAALIVASLLWHGPAVAEERQTTCFVFEPIAARSGPAVKDFSSFSCAKCEGGKVRPELNAALRAYQAAPSMQSAIGILQFFTSDFYKMSVEERRALFAADRALFLSVDIAKYEIIMHVRKELAKSGAKRSIRVGSSGQRELAIIQWIARGRTGDDPGLSPPTSSSSVTTMSPTTSWR
jgi:hypothetical protein